MAREIGAELVARLQHMSDSLEPVCPYVTGTVTRYCTLTPFTLTDAEREAIVVAAAWLQAHPSHHAATLRGLLDRTKDGEK